MSPSLSTCLPVAHPVPGRRHSPLNGLLQGSHRLFHAVVAGDPATACPPFLANLQPDARVHAAVLQVGGSEGGSEGGSWHASCLLLAHGPGGAAVEACLPACLRLPNSVDTGRCRLGAAASPPPMASFRGPDDTSCTPTVRGGVAPPGPTSHPLLIFSDL